MPGTDIIDGDLYLIYIDGDVPPIDQHHQHITASMHRSAGCPAAPDCWLAPNPSRSRPAAYPKTGSLLSTPCLPRAPCARHAPLILHVRAPRTQRADTDRSTSSTTFIMGEAADYEQIFAGVAAAEEDGRVMRELRDWQRPASLPR